MSKDLQASKSGTPTVYLLHFAKRYKHAQHYLGYTDNLEARLEQHRTGKGARLLQVIVAAGIKFRCVRKWIGGRAFERKLKNRHGPYRLCPLCQRKQKA